jgi:hypothetical protein
MNMKKHRLILGIVVALLFLGVLTPQFAQDSPRGPQKPDFEKRALALGFMRTINTAEVTELSQYGSYAPWETLLAHKSEYMNGWLARYFPQAARFGDLPEVLPGYSLRLDVHADGRGFDVRVQDLKDKCGFAAFSDEEGVIWQGKWIDCKIE